MAKIEKAPVALTSDLWTSHALQGYITLTGHHISPDWSLQANVIGTRVVEQRHTGSNIAAEVRKLTQEFKISSLSAIVTENAGNMASAARELDLFQVGCFAHYPSIGN